MDGSGAAASPASGQGPPRPRAQAGELMASAAMRPRSSHPDQAQVQVLALRAAIGALDPRRDDARVAGCDDALGRQPVQAGTDRALRRPGIAGPAWPPTGTRPCRPARRGCQADEYLHAPDGCPPRPAGTGARFRAPRRSPRRSRGVATQTCCPAEGRPASYLTGKSVRPARAAASGGAQPSRMRGQRPVLAARGQRVPGWVGSDNFG